MDIDNRVAKAWGQGGNQWEGGNGEKRGISTIISTIRLKKRIKNWNEIIYSNSSLLYSYSNKGCAIGKRIDI